MKNLFFGALIFCFAMFSCTRDSVEFENVNDNVEAEIETRACFEDYHCQDFPAYSSTVTCDLDLTSFVFTPNPNSSATGILIEIISTSGWSLGYDPNKGPRDPNVSFVDASGQALTGQFNQLIIECGQKVVIITGACTRHIIHVYVS